MYANLVLWFSKLTIKAYTQYHFMFDDRTHSRTIIMMTYLFLYASTQATGTPTADYNIFVLIEF